MYAQDSFFTLSIPGQVGLACVSLCLALLVVWLCWRVRGPWWVRMGGALVAVWLFVWLSPQLYYAYYLLIIPGLPVQWVLHAPPSPLHMAQLATFSGAQNLSAHSQGVLIWLAILAATLKKSHLRRNAAN